MRKLRIAHIISNPSVKYQGGIAQFLQNLLYFINKKKTENFVITHFCDNLTQRKLEDMGANLYTLVDEINETSLSPFQTLKSLQTILKTIQPDIVNTHNHWADLYGRQAAKKANVSIIITREANIITDETNQYKNSKSRLTKITDTVICISEGVKKYALTVDNVPESKLKVIYNGIKLEEHPFKSNCSQDFDNNLVSNFVFVARLEPQKAPCRVINAMATLQRKGHDCYLSIIGDGSLKSECEQQVRQFNLNHRVKFFGYQEKPWQLVSPDSIFVMTSDFEGFGQTITEAMATGCLCILPTLEPALEIATDNKEALFYEVGDQQKLEEKMELALHLSAEEKLAIIKEARMRVEQKFDAKIMAENYLNLYQQLYQTRNNAK